MTLLAWNCRGIGSSLVSDTLQDLNTRLRPRLLFLCETKSTSTGVVPLLCSLGFQPTNYFVIDCNATYAGGLAMAWHNSFSVSLFAFDSFYIAITVELSPGYSAILIGVYLHTDYQTRQTQFSAIVNLIQSVHLPYIVFGDFNVVLDSSEKTGGGPIRQLPVTHFRTFVNNLALADIGFHDPPFTWSNLSHTPSLVIQSRLDRFLLSPQILVDFSSALARHHSDVGSDHRVISLTLEPSQNMRTKRLFRFDNRWATNPEVTELIQSIWAVPVVGSHMFRLQTRLKSVRHALYSWSRSGTSNSARQMRHFRDEIDRLRNTFPPPWPAISLLETELRLASAQEASYWRAKSRNDWLLSGDRNTAFFTALRLLADILIKLGPLLY
ncbi:hypothetical protein LINGRAPRIM_LOCUS2790 [Linum grandiflorum]